MSWRTPWLGAPPAADMRPPCGCTVAASLNFDLYELPCVVYAVVLVASSSSSSSFRGRVSCRPQGETFKGEGIGICNPFVDHGGTAAEIVVNVTMQPSITD